jgi:hypothetical protein
MSESFVEGLKISHSHVGCDLFDRHVGVPQEMFGAHKAALYQMAYHCSPKVLLKEPGEVVMAESDGLGKRSDGNGFGHSGLHDPERLIYRRMEGSRRGTGLRCAFGVLPEEIPDLDFSSQRFDWKDSDRIFKFGPRGSECIAHSNHGRQVLEDFARRFEVDVTVGGSLAEDI